MHFSLSSKLIYMPYFLIWYFVKTECVNTFFWIRVFKTRKLWEIRSFVDDSGRKLSQRSDPHCSNEPERIWSQLRRYVIHPLSFLHGSDHGTIAYTTWTGPMRGCHVIKTWSTFVSRSKMFTDVAVIHWLPRFTTPLKSELTRIQWLLNSESSWVGDRVET